MTNEQFTLEGVTYSAQTRTCNNPGCHCHTDKPHGPYWYARDRTTGKQTYIGKKLPDAILAARATHRAQRKAMEATYARLEDEWGHLGKRLQTLRRHMTNDNLTQLERDLITELGHGDTLVQPAAPPATQDAS